MSWLASGIDIILWDENPAQFVINAMAPGRSQFRSWVDEDSKSMDIAVEEDNLSQAIGRGRSERTPGCRVTGWTLNVMTIEEARARKARPNHAAFSKCSCRSSTWTKKFASILVQEGFTNVEEVA